MGLVDYSDSESETETVQQKPTPTFAAPPTKKPFQKLLDRSSGTGKIVVNLPAAGAATDADADDDQPPAKRAKVSGGSRFSSLGSFLPPPKKTGATAAPKKTGSAPAPGVHLRTGAEPAFVRGGGEEEGTVELDGDGAAPSGVNVPATNSKAQPGPSIPEGQKPEEEVKLVGKPLMFKPLSVARKKVPAKNKKRDAAAAGASPSPGGAAAPSNGPTTSTPAATSNTAPPQKKKISLFSIGDDDDEAASAAPTTTDSTGTYEPLFFTSAENGGEGEEEAESDVTAAYPTYQHHHYQQQQQQQQQRQPPPQQPAQDDALSSLASTLSPAARRELFGRSSSSSSSSSNNNHNNAKVISFDMEREYAHNEELRQSGAGARLAYNPVRSIAPGKHNLRQVVNMAQSNREALEESFARAKANQRDAAGRYGW
ncbi:hypothetical protein L209DRAFT_751749 [Thermothelomyces heterothallicus CBS 203.75]